MRDKPAFFIVCAMIGLLALDQALAYMYAYGWL